MINTIDIDTVNPINHVDINPAVRNDPELRPAPSQPYLVPGLQDALLHLPSVDERSVGALQVLEEHPLRVGVDHRVVGRDAAVFGRERDGVAWAAPYADRAAGKREAAALTEVGAF